MAKKKIRGLLTTNHSKFNSSSNVHFIDVSKFYIKTKRISRVFFWFFFFLVFRAAPMAYGGSQARGSNQSYGCWPTPQPQQHRIQAAFATYNLSSWQHQILNPVSKAMDCTATSWFLVGFISTAPQWER